MVIRANEIGQEIRRKKELSKLRVKAEGRQLSAPEMQAAILYLLQVVDELQKNTN